MAFNNGFTAVTGATYTAAQYNTHTRDNMTAIWVYTTAGDIAYASSATVLARLAIGSAGKQLGISAGLPAWVDGVPGIFTTLGDLVYGTGADAAARLARPASIGLLQNDAAGALAWLTGGSALQVLRKNAANTAFEWAQSTGLHKVGNVYFAPGGQSFAGGWADITGATLDLVTTVACTIVVLAVVTGYNGTTGRGFYYRAMVNAVADPAAGFPFNGGAARNEAMPYVYYVTGVAAGTRTVKLQCQADTDPNVVERGRLIALAFAE